MVPSSSTFLADTSVTPPAPPSPPSIAPHCALPTPPGPPLTEIKLDAVSVPLEKTATAPPPPPPPPPAPRPPSAPGAPSSTSGVSTNMSRSDNTISGLLPRTSTDVDRPRRNASKSNTHTGADDDANVTRRRASTSLRQPPHTYVPDDVSDPRFCDTGDALGSSTPNRPVASNGRTGNEDDDEGVAPAGVMAASRQASPATELAPIALLRLRSVPLIG